MYKKKPRCWKCGKLLRHRDKIDRYPYHKTNDWFCDLCKRTRLYSKSWVV